MHTQSIKECAALEDIGNSTALMAASKNGYSDCISPLIEAHADINETNTYGDTALILASKKGHHECVSLLIMEIGRASCRERV